MRALALGLVISLAGCGLFTAKAAPQLGARATAVAVREFRTDSGGTLTVAGKELGATFAKRVVSALHSRGQPATLLARDASPPQSVRYLIDGEVTAVDFRKSGTPLFFGFSGQSLVMVRARILDLTTGRTLCDDPNVRGSGIWVGEDEVLRHSAEHLAERVLRQIGSERATVAAASVHIPD